MNDIIERMRSGKRISETDSDFPRLCEEIENTRRLVAELNTGYHSPDEVRSLLERIWGQSLDASVRMFPPFYTAFGKTTRVGKNVFVNFGCTFLDQGGITLEDGVFIGPESKILTEAHPEQPEIRHTLQTEPVVIRRKAWIGAGFIFFKRSVTSLCTVLLLTPNWPAACRTVALFFTIYSAIATARSSIGVF